MKNWFFLSVGLLISLAFTSEPLCQSGSNLDLAFDYHEPIGVSITVMYTLPQSGYTTIKIFNIIGVEVLSLANGEQPAGTHSITWSSRGLAGGIYFCRLEAPNGVKLRKFIVF